MKWFYLALATVCFLPSAFAEDKVLLDCVGANEPAVKVQLLSEGTLGDQKLKVDGVPYIMGVPDVNSNTYTGCTRTVKQDTQNSNWRSVLVKCGKESDANRASFEGPLETNNTVESGELSLVAAYSALNKKKLTCVTK
jgi:hypothetical protein